MKRIIALILIMLLCFGNLSACYTPESSTSDERVKIRVGYMTGPTGMGMAKLIADNGGLENRNEYYSFTKYTDTNAAKADLAVGKIDIICLPTNEAAAYRSKLDESAVVLAVNCLNSLYYISSEGDEVDSLSDLEGQTIYTCKNGTPRIILEYILAAAGINATVSCSVDGKEMLTPQDLSAQAIAGNIPNAVMPEPLVTSTVLNAKASSVFYSVKIDMGEEWNAICDTPLTMGCVIASGAFVAESKASVDLFLEEYKASVEFISNSANLDSAAEYVVNMGVMGAVPAAKMALKNLGNSICYMDGEDMKAALTAFYNAMGINPPEEEFYYEK